MTIGMQTWTLAELRRARDFPRGATFALVDGSDTTTKPIRDHITADFVRLGYAGASLDFKTPVTDLATFTECMRVIGGYNRFDGGAVAEAIGAMFGELMQVEVGRESSPVLYVYIPFHAQQRIGSRKGCVRIPEGEREALVARVREMGKSLMADEISEQRHEGRPYCVRLWWD